MTNTTSMTIEQKHYNTLQANAHQCGLLNRASRLLLQSKNLHQAAEVLQSTLEDFPLSGYVKLFTHSKNLVRKFGQGIPRRDFATIRDSFKSNNKIQVRNEHLLIQTANTQLIVKLEAKLLAYSGLVQDNLAIYCDTLQAWVEAYQAKRQLQQQQLQERLSSAQQLQDLVHCLTKLNGHLLQNHQLIVQELLSALLAQFPTLALQADQEEAILDVVNRSLNKQGQLLDAQVQNNNETKVTLNRAIASLVAELSSRETIAEPGATDNLRSIELF